MDIDKAYKILNLSPPISLQSLKKAYHREALLHHPDRHKDNTDKKETTQKFQDINEAYETLSNYIGDNEHDYTNFDSSYEGILRKFIYNTIGNKSSEIDLIINNITKKCSSFSQKMLDNLDKKTLLKIFDYINTNNDILNINSSIVDFINDYVVKKTEKDCVYNLNPTLDDILRKDVYLLFINEKKYYIPLWHSEIQFEEDKCIIVRCEPELPKHITIDHNNDLNVNLAVNFENILDRVELEFMLGSTKYSIPIEKLYIKKHQVYTLINQGIPKINNNDIYDCKKIGDIIVNIDMQ